MATDPSPHPDYRNRPTGQGELAARGAVTTDRSGGTLVNEAGQVAGITTAIASTGGGYIGRQSGSIGVGFAIPVNTTRALSPRSS